jgi:diaminopimelate decarboxylase
MTLSEILPSLGGMLVTRLEPEVWPSGTTRTPDGDLVVGGVGLSALADRFGTPLHVLDEAELRARCRDYRNALPDAEIMLAGEAFVRSAGALRCLAEEGMALAVGSGRDAALARANGVPAHRLLVAGSPAGREQAIAGGCGRVTAGSRRDVRVVARLADGRQDVLVDVARRRGAGVRIDYDRAMTVVRRLLAEESLRFAGLRCVVAPGTDVPAIEAVVRRLVQLAIELRDTYGVVTRELGIAGEHRGADGFDLRGFAARVNIALRLECARHRLRPPRLLVEPGRAFTARAGVALRRVVAVADGRLVVVDGPAGGRRVQVTGRSAAKDTRALAVVGRDGTAVHGVRLPADVRTGDLLAFAGADAAGWVPLVTVAAGVAEAG